MSCVCVSMPQAITLAFAYRQVYTAVLFGGAPVTFIYSEENNKIRCCRAGAIELASTRQLPVANTGQEYDAFSMSRTL